MSARDRIQIAKGGTLVGTRPRVNFTDSPSVTWTVTDSTAGVNVSATAAGGGGTPFEIWAAQAVPSGLHANSYDRGDGTGIFTELDNASTLTGTEDDFGLKMVNSGTGQTGLFQAKPVASGTEFSITINMTGKATKENYRGWGFMFAEDLAANPTTANLNLLRWEADTGSPNIVMQLFTDPATYNSNFFNVLDIGWLARGPWWRISVNAAHTQFALAISHDGVMWEELQFNQAFSSLAALASVGVVCDFSGNSNPVWLAHWRVRTGSGTYRNMDPEGGLVTVTI